MVNGVQPYKLEKNMNILKNLTKVSTGILLFAALFACGEESVAPVVNDEIGQSSAALNTLSSTGEVQTQSSQAEISISSAAEVRENLGLTIYFIRHAQTMANVTGDHSEENENSFSDLGLEQIEALKNYLNGEGIIPDQVLVSPKWRTQNTILPWLEEHSDIPAEIWPELEECCYQDSSGIEPPEIPFYGSEIELYSPLYEYRDENSTRHWNVGYLEAGYAMVAAARDSLLNRYSQSGKTIFIVGHYLNGNAFLSALQEHDFTEEFYIKNTGVQYLTQDPTSGQIQLILDNINNPDTGK
jgi:broad specificity phosphatase PhoE